MSRMVLLSVKQEYSFVLIRKYEESIKFWSQILEKWSNSRFCRDILRQQNIYILIT